MNKSHNTNSRIAHNTLFLYLRMTIVMFVSLYTARVVLRVLGSDDFGVYSVVCGFVSLFTVLNVTLTNGTQRYYNEEIGKKNSNGVTKVFNASIRIQSFLAIALIIIAESLGLWYIETRMIIEPERQIAALWIFHFSLLSLILLVLQAPFSSAIISYERMDFYALVSISDVLIKLGMVFLIQKISFDKLIGYGALMLIASLINFVICISYCMIKFKEIRFRHNTDKVLLKRLTKFSGWLILDPIAYTMRGQGCNMVLNLFFGTLINAAYGIANQVGASLDSFCSNIATAFKPQLMQSYSAGNYNRTIKLLYSMSKIMFVLKLMLCVPIILEVQTILHFWLGEGFPTYALSFAALTVIVRLVDSLNLPISMIVLATGKIKKYMIWTSAIVFSTLPVSFFLFKIGCNPNATFYAMIGLTLINQYISIIILNQCCDFFIKTDYFRNVIIPCILQAIIVITISMFVSKYIGNAIYRLLSVCTTSIIISMISAYFFILTFEEKKMVSNIAKNFFAKKTYES